MQNHVPSAWQGGASTPCGPRRRKESPPMERFVVPAMDNDMGVVRRKPCDFSGAPAGRAQPPGGPCERMACDGPPGGRPLPASLTMQKTKFSPDNSMSSPGRAAVPGRRGAREHAPSLHAGSAVIHGRHNKFFCSFPEVSHPHGRAEARPSPGVRSTGRASARPLCNRWRDKGLRPHNYLERFAK